MAFVHLATATQNAAVNAAVDLIDAGAAAGYINIYAANGDGIPANANTAVTDQTLLSEHTFSDPAFGAAVAGVVTASAIADDTSANASGTAAWARVFDSDDNVVMDVDVGTTGTTLIMASVTITAGQEVTIDSGQFTMPSGV